VYLPLYTMVTFTRIPYRHARRRAQVQDYVVYAVLLMAGLAMLWLLARLTGLRYPAG
jgi:hypothetical protein